MKLTAPLALCSGASLIFGFFVGRLTAPSGITADPDPSLSSPSLNPASPVSPFASIPSGNAPSSDETEESAAARRRMELASESELVEAITSANRDDPASTLNSLHATTRLAELNPVRSAELALDTYRQTGSNDEFLLALRTWCFSSPEEAIEWLDREAALLEELELTVPCQAGASQALARKNFPAALKRIQSRPEKERRYHLSSLLVDHWSDPQDRDLLLSFLKQQSAKEVREAIWVATNLRGLRSPEPILPLLSSAELVTAAGGKKELYDLLFGVKAEIPILHELSLPSPDHELVLEGLGALEASIGPARYQSFLRKHQNQFPPELLKRAKLISESE